MKKKIVLCCHPFAVIVVNHRDVAATKLRRPSRLVVAQHQLGLVRCHHLSFVVIVVAVKPKQMIKLIKKTCSTI
jgi:hypothetical protein